MALPAAALAGGGPKIDSRSGSDGGLTAPWEGSFGAAWTVSTGSAKTTTGSGLSTTTMAVIAGVALLALVVIRKKA